jgi:hypothetical protein
LKERDPWMKSCLRSAHRDPVKCVHAAVSFDCDERGDAFPSTVEAFDTWRNSSTMPSLSAFGGGTRLVGSDELHDGGQQVDFDCFKAMSRAANSRWPQIECNAGNHGGFRLINPPPDARSNKSLFAETQLR